MQFNVPLLPAICVITVYIFQFSEQISSQRTFQPTEFYAALHFMLHYILKSIFRYFWRGEMLSEVLYSGVKFQPVINLLHTNTSKFHAASYYGTNAVRDILLDCNKKYSFHLQQF